MKLYENEDPFTLFYAGECTYLPFSKFASFLFLKYVNVSNNTVLDV